MPPYGKYLSSGIFANLTLYYLVTTFTPVINIFIAFIALIDLFRCLINSLFASDLSDNRTEIASFSEYNIFIVFIDYGIFFSRLISVFNSSIRSSFGILFTLPCLVNMSLLETSVFFVSFFSVGRPFFWTIVYWSFSCLSDRSAATFA